MQRTVLALVVTILVLAVGTASAQSAKATAQVGNINVMDEVTSNGSNNAVWTDILSASLHTSQQKDLFVDASLECGLLTRTLVKSKNGDSDTAEAAASIRVRVLVDKDTANERTFEPGEVVFCRRTQTLTAVFQGLIDGCLSVDDEGNVILDEDCVQPEELELILETMNANAFNFVLDDMGAGDHTITVQARIDVSAEANLGSAEARGLIGKGAVVVEEVRLVKDQDFTIQ